LYGRICDAVPQDEGHLLGVSHIQTDEREGCGVAQGAASAESRDEGGSAPIPTAPDLLGARTSRKDLQGKVTLPYHVRTSKEKREQPAPSPALGLRVITCRQGNWVPTPKTTINGTHLITPFMSRLSIRQDHVSRIYEGRPLGASSRSKQVNLPLAHKVTET